MIQAELSISFVPNHGSTCLPVNSTAVDERGEHPKAVPERVANGRHGHHNAQIGLHSLHVEPEHG